MRTATTHPDSVWLMSAVPFDEMGDRQAKLYWGASTGQGRVATRSPDPVRSLDGRDDSLTAPLSSFDRARIFNSDCQPLVRPVVGNDDETHSPPCERRQHLATLGPRELLAVDLDHGFAPVVAAAIVDGATQDIAACAQLARELRPFDLRLPYRDLDRDVLVVAPNLIHGGDLVESLEDIRVRHAIERGSDLKMRRTNLVLGVLDHRRFAVGLSGDPNLVRRSYVAKAAHRRLCTVPLLSCRPAPTAA